MRLRPIAAVMDGLVMVPITLAQLGIPDPTVWAGLKPGLGGAVGLAALISISGARDSVIAFKFRTEIAQFKNSVNVRLAGLADAVSRTSGTDVIKLGTHLFVAKPTSLPARPPRARLYCAGTFRMSERPSMFNPTWVSGKGVVGRSFETGTFLAADWGGWAAQMLQTGPAQWKQMDRRDRFAMNWGELEQSSGYDSIFAHPFFDSSGRVAGVITVDGPDLTGDSDEVRALMRSASARMTEIYPPPLGWWVANGH